MDRSLADWKSSSSLDLDLSLGSSSSSSSLDLDLSLGSSSSDEGTLGRSRSSFIGVLDLEIGGVGDLGGRGRDFTAVILLSSIRWSISTSGGSLLPLGLPLVGVLDLSCFGSGVSPGGGCIGMSLSIGGADLALERLFLSMDF